MKAAQTGRSFVGNTLHTTQTLKVDVPTSRRGHVVPFSSLRVVGIDWGATRVTKSSPILVCFMHVGERVVASALPIVRSGANGQATLRSELGKYHELQVLAQAGHETTGVCTSVHFISVHRS